MEWRMSEIHALRDMAGDFPAYAIAECLGRSTESVKAQAKRWGIDLTCNKDGLYWCNDCMTWRTTKKCVVCRENHLTEMYDRATEEYGVPMTVHMPVYNTHSEMGYEEAEKADQKEAHSHYNQAYKQWERVSKQFMILSYLAVRNEDVA